jgi:hypothetical protein
MPGPDEKKDPIENSNLLDFAQDLQKFQIKIAVRHSKRVRGNLVELALFLL